MQGDGRYLITNSKDQSIKLWDVRRFSPKEGMEATLSRVQQQDWDYRYMNVPKKSETGVTVNVIYKVKWGRIEEKTFLFDWDNLNYNCKLYNIM